jgi:hypothetical protein
VRSRSAPPAISARASSAEQLGKAGCVSVCGHA